MALKDKSSKKVGMKMYSYEESLAHMKKHRPDLAYADAHPSIRYFLAVNLATHMRKKKMTQTALAKKSGLSLRCIQGMASPAETTHPTLESIDAVALALGIRVVDLLRTWKETIHV
jgi:hypothetical protein